MSSTNLEGQQGEGGGHVGVLAFPFTSHATTLLTLIRHLASLTPNTTYSFFSTSKSNATNFGSHQQHSCNNIRPYDVEDGVPDGYVFSGMLHEDIKLFLEAAPLKFTEKLKAAVADTGRKVSVLITDAFLWFGADIAKEFQVPWICVWTSAFLFLSTQIHTALIKDTFSQGEISGREDETLAFIPGMANIRLRDLPDGIVIGQSLSPVYPGMFRQMVKALPEATAIFVGSFEELEPDIANDMKSKLKKSYTIGPFNLMTKPSPAPDGYGCLPWLDKQKPASVAYISFGTTAVLPEKEMVALAEALEASRVPFLWSLKEHLQKKLPKGFLERTKEQGLVVPWAPQVDVLSHCSVGVFLTQCGWQSLMQSIAGGVPLICRPCFGDQKINSRLTTDVWKIGMTVERGMFTEDFTKSMLKDFIQSSEKWRKMRENVFALKQAAERAVGPDGSSTRNLRLLSNMVSSNAF